MNFSTVRQLALPTLAAIAVTALFFAAFVNQHTGNELTPIERVDAQSSDVAPAEPILPNDEFTQSLILKEWPTEAALSVAKLNQAWFDCVKDETMRERQMLHLRQLGVSGISLHSLIKEPHFASLLATLSSTDLRHNLLKLLTVDVAVDDRPSILNAFLREAGRRKAESLTRFLQDHLALELEIQHKGLIGAEVLLLGAANTHATAALSGWLTEILQMGQGGNLNEFLPYFCLFVCQGQDLASRMAAEPDFQKRFRNQLWPQFKRLTRKNGGTTSISGPSVAHLMSEPAIWTMFADPEGAQLIADFGLIPVVLLHGDQAFPSKLHSRIKTLLKSRIKYINERLLDLDLRSNPDFISLLEKRIDIRILATALYQVQQQHSLEQRAAKLRQFAVQTETELTEELGPLESPVGLFDAVPQGIYLHVGFKALSSQRISRREWEKVARTAVLDVMMLLSKYRGVPPIILKRFETIVPVALNFVDDFRDQRLKEAQQQANHPLTADEQERMQRDAESELVHSQKFIQALELVRDLVSRPPNGSVVDLTPSVLFFAELTPDELRSPEIVDWRQVAVYGLPDHRAFIGFRPDSAFARQHPQIAQFFNDRVLTIRRHFDALPGTQTRATGDAAEVALRESVSAWWLLAVSGDLPLANWHSDLNSQQIIAPASSRQ